MNSGTRSLSRLLFFLVALLSSCAAAAKDELSTEMERIYKSRPTEILWMDHVWENERWKRGHGGLRYNVSFTEFVLPPETVKNWTELLTLEVIWKTSKTYPGPFDSFTAVPDPVDGMERIRVAIQARCTSPVAFEKIDEDRQSAYPSVRFYIACEKFQDGSVEAQVHQVSQGKVALFHVHRNRRAASLDKATISYWAEGLKRMYVCDNKIAGQECGKKKFDKLLKPPT